MTLSEKRKSEATKAELVLVETVAIADTIAPDASTYPVPSSKTFNMDHHHWSLTSDPVFSHLVHAVNHTLSSSYLITSKWILDAEMEREALDETGGVGADDQHSTAAGSQTLPQSKVTPVFAPEFSRFILSSNQDINDEFLSQFPALIPYRSLLEQFYRYFDHSSKTDADRPTLEVSDFVDACETLLNWPSFVAERIFSALDVGNRGQIDLKTLCVGFSTHILGMRSGNSSEEVTNLLFGAFCKNAREGMSVDQLCDLVEESNIYWQSQSQTQDQVQSTTLSRDEAKRIATNAMSLIGVNASAGRLNVSQFRALVEKKECGIKLPHVDLSKAASVDKLPSMSGTEFIYNPWLGHVALLRLTTGFIASVNLTLHTRLCELEISTQELSTGKEDLEYDRLYREEKLKVLEKKETECLIRIEEGHVQLGQIKQETMDNLADNNGRIQRGRVKDQLQRALHQIEVSIMLPMEDLYMRLNDRVETLKDNMTIQQSLLYGVTQESTTNSPSPSPSSEALQKKIEALLKSQQEKRSRIAKINARFEEQKLKIASLHNLIVTTLAPVSRAEKEYHQHLRKYMTIAKGMKSEIDDLETCANRSNSASIPLPRARYGGSDAGMHASNGGGGVMTPVRSTTQFSLQPSRLLVTPSTSGGFVSPLAMSYQNKGITMSSSKSAQLGMSTGKGGLLLSPDPHSASSSASSSSSSSSSTDQLKGISNALPPTTSLSSTHLLQGRRNGRDHGLSAGSMLPTGASASVSASTSDGFLLRTPQRRALHTPTPMMADTPNNAQTGQSGKIDQRDNRMNQLKLTEDEIKSCNQMQEEQDDMIEKLRADVDAVERRILDLRMGGGH